MQEENSQTKLFTKDENYAIFPKMGDPMELIKVVPEIKVSRSDSCYVFRLEDGENLFFAMVPFGYEEEVEEVLIALLKEARVNQKVHEILIKKAMADFCSEDLPIIDFVKLKDGQSQRFYN